MLLRMNKYGPTRGEWLFRLAFSLAGLGMLVLLVVLRGVPKGAGLVEVFGVSVLFFGGTAAFALRALLRRDGDR